MPPPPADCAPLPDSVALVSVTAPPLRAMAPPPLAVLPFRVLPVSDTVAGLLMLNAPPLVLSALFWLKVLSVTMIAPPAV